MGDRFSNPGRVLISADDGRILEFDNYGKYLVSIDSDHHHIHEAVHYFYSDCVTLGLAGTQDYMLTVPDDATNRKHVTFSVVGSGALTLALLEGGDRVGTTLQTTYNNDRDSENVATMLLHKDTSGGTVDGTDIHPDCGGANKQEGVSERNNEIILKTNTKYIIRVTSGVASNVISVHLDWYEKEVMNN